MRDGFFGIETVPLINCIRLVGDSKYQLREHEKLYG